MRLDWLSPPDKIEDRTSVDGGFLKKAMFRKEMNWTATELVIRDMLYGSCTVWPVYHQVCPLFFLFPSSFLAFPRMELFNSQCWEALNQIILLLEPSGVWHISCRVIKQEIFKRCKTLCLVLDYLTCFHRSFQSSHLQTPSVTCCMCS